MVIFILSQQFEGNSHGREGRHMGQDNVDKLLDFNSTLKTNDPLENIFDGVVKLGKVLPSKIVLLQREVQKRGRIEFNVIQQKRCGLQCREDNKPKCEIFESSREARQAADEKEGQEHEDKT